MYQQKATCWNFFRGGGVLNFFDNIQNVANRSKKLKVQEKTTKNFWQHFCVSTKGNIFNFFRGGIVSGGIKLIRLVYQSSKWQDFIFSLPIFWPYYLLGITTLHTYLYTNTSKIFYTWKNYFYPPPPPSHHWKMRRTFFLKDLLLFF